MTLKQLSKASFLFMVVGLSFTYSANAQSTAKLFILPYTDQISSPYSAGDSVKVQTVNAAQLTARMAADLAAHPNTVLQVVVSSSTTCGGHPVAIRYIEKLFQRYGDSIQFYMVVGNKERDAPSFLKTAQLLPPGTQFYIVSDQYRHKGDDRRRADDMTKEMFPESKERIIGTPKYYIINRSGTLLYYSFGFSTHEADPYGAINSPVETYFEKEMGRR